MILPDPLEFHWDEGNVNKNLVKHGISNQDIEEAFLDVNKLIFTDPLHSGSEERFRIVAKTSFNKLLFIAFTIREDRIRVISARNINKREVNLYEKRT